MLKRLRKAHPILFCVLAEVVFLASLFVTDLVFTIALVLFQADFASIDTYLYSTLQELVGAMVAVLFLVRTDRAGLLRRRGSGFFNGLLVGMYPLVFIGYNAFGSLVLFIGGRGLWQFVTAEQVEQITAQNMETAWNVARQGGYEDVSLLATQEFEQIFVLKK